MASECPICLDPLCASTIAGKVHGCNHTYHKECIFQWAANLSLCPTCRKPLTQIDVVALSAPEVVLQTTKVQAKLLATDAINNIPQEFIIRPQQYAIQEASAARDAEDDAHASSGVCLICSSAAYSARARAMVGCAACGAKFHRNCLGHVDEPAWFCPVCDCHQEMPLLGGPRAARVAMSEPRPRRGLSIFNEHGEIEGFDDLDPVALPVTRPRSSVLNGGVLMRREARARQNLSPDEARAWSAFESARSGADSAVERAVVELQPRRKRRRPRPAETASASALQADPEVQPGRSRISLLMSQIRSLTMTLVPNVDRAPQLAFPSEYSPQSSHPLTPASSPQSTSSDLAEKIPPLSLENKQMVQTHVRNVLRPLYNGDVQLRRIKTEEEYIHINKSLSRQIYTHISSLCASKGPQCYDELFAGDSNKLQQLVDTHFEDWTRDSEREQ